MPDDSRKWIEDASRGDVSAVDALLERHLPALNAYVRLRSGKLLRDRESSADLVQSVCREVLENLDRYRYRGEAEFRRWLYTTAARKIVDRVQYYKAQKRDVGREVRIDGPSAFGVGAAAAMAAGYRGLSTPSRHLMTAEEIHRIESAFEQLPEEYREVILLARIVGLSRAEIGEQMGRSDVAVRALLHRALADLAERLDDEAPASA